MMKTEDRYGRWDSDTMSTTSSRVSSEKTDKSSVLEHSIADSKTKSQSISLEEGNCYCRLLQNDGESLTPWDDDDAIVTRLKGGKQTGSSAKSGKGKSKQSQQSQKWSYRYANTGKTRQEPEEGPPMSSFVHHGDLRKYISDYRNEAMSARAVHVRGGKMPILGENVPDPYMPRLKCMGDEIMERITLLSKIAKETERTQRIIKENPWKTKPFLKLPKVIFKDTVTKTTDTRRTKSASEVEEEVFRLPKISEDMKIEDLEDTEDTTVMKHTSKEPLKLPDIKPVNFQFKPGKSSQFVLKLAMEDENSRTRKDVSREPWLQAEKQLQLEANRPDGDKGNKDASDAEPSSPKSTFGSRKQDIHLAQTRHHNTKSFAIDSTPFKELPSLRTTGKFPLPITGDSSAKFAYIKGNRLNGAIPEPRRRLVEATSVTNVGDSWYSSFTEDANRNNNNLSNKMAANDKAIVLDAAGKFMSQTLTDPVLCQQYLTRLETMRQIFELRSPPPKAATLGKVTTETRPLGSCKNQKKFKPRHSLTPTEQAKETLSKLGILGNPYRTKDAHDAYMAAIRQKNVSSTHV